MKQPTNEELLNFAKLIVEKQKEARNIEIDPDDQDWTLVEDDWYMALQRLLGIPENLTP